MTSTCKVYQTSVIPGKAIHIFDIQGGALLYPVHATLELVELVECDLCHDKIRLGLRRSTPSFLAHRGSGICKKAASQRRKRHTQNIEIHQSNEAMQNVALQLKIPKGVPSNPDSFPFEAESIPMLLTPLQSNTTPILTTLVTPQSKIFGQSNLPELFQFTTPCPSNPVLPQFLRTGNPSVLTTQSSLPLSSAPHSPVSQLSSPSLSTNGFDSSSEGNMGNSWDRFDSKSGSKSLAHEIATENGDWANSCTGQLIQWLPGSVWDLYAYHQHTNDSLPWTLISVEDPDWIQIRAKRCNFLLHTELERNWHAYVPCQKLANSSEFKRFMSNASKDLKQFTPIRYLNQRQLRQMYLSTHKKFNDLKLKAFEVQLGPNRLRNDSVVTSQRYLHMNKMNLTQKSEVYIDIKEVNSQSKFNDETAAHAGHFGATATADLGNQPRLQLQVRLFPVAVRSSCGLLRLVQLDLKTLIIPTAIHEKLEMAILGAYTPQSKWTNWELDVAFLIKSTAGLHLLYTLQQHSGHADDVKQTVDTIQDLDNLANALEKDMTHRGKDSTVLGLAPISMDENYFVSPLVLSGSCKSETGNDILIWIMTFVQCYYSSPHGRMRHGDLTNIATDSKSSFQKLRFLFGCTEDLDCESKLGELLYQLPGFNCQTGIHQIITMCNPKHVIKRFATMIRSPTEIQIGDTQITAEHIFEALTRCGKMPRNKAHQLLHPGDKQNVPKAVNLLQSLFDLEKLKLDWEHLPSLWKHFYVEMSLAHQIQSISTFAHLITAMFQKHKTSFLTSALIADSQAIAKSVIFNTAQLQIVDPESHYYILFKGTDRLESVFSHAPQDHAQTLIYSNLSRSLVLAQKLTLFSNVTQIWTVVIFAATLPKPKVSTMRVRGKRLGGGASGPDVSEFNGPQDTLDPGSGKYDNATIEPMEETLNPEMEKNATHYIIFEGRRLFKPKLISRQLSSDSARKVTIWPLCAQGVSVLEMLNRRLQVLNQSQEDGTKANTVKVGDLGAALTRVGNNVWLAIVEVLNFRQTKSKNINLTAVDMNDLDFASKTGMTIAVQIQDLAPAPSADKPLMWIWTQKYIQLQPSKDGTRSQHHLAIQIPGMLFVPLGPDVIYEKDSDTPQWSLKDSELKEVMDCAWEALSPDSNEILNNLEALPLINGTGLPYRYCIDRVWEKTFIVDLPPRINLAKKNGKDEIKCFICAAKTQLRNMQKHVGKHILLALQRFQD
ncbi:hypothetical protein B0H34DRAFT_675971 [Crassisporium funariophilum]|nr:hypothetical protein B0H34DRAFT_675971 [Crassisporium funariophilum]